MIGAGHNRMILAGYLSRAGLKIAIVERMLEIGGGLDSHEAISPPGFHHNVHSVNHRGLTSLPWYRDLGLEELGQQYIDLPIAAAMVLRDRRSIIWHKDLDRTCRTLAQFSKRDAEIFRSVSTDYKTMSREIFFNELYHPPLPLEEKIDILKKSAAGRQYLEWRPLTIRETVEKLFENDRIRALICTLQIFRGREIDAPGQGFVIPASIASGVASQMAKGTSHSLAHTLHKMVVRNGADMIEQREVTRLIIEGGRTTGVELWDGTIIKARHFVATSTNPHQTFLTMVGQENISEEFANKVDGFRYSMTNPLFGLHLSLNERPRYLAEQVDPDVGRAWIIIAGLEGMDGIESIYKESRAGKVPTTHWLIGAAPGQHDPTQAPPDKCTAFMWQMAPGRLAEAEGGPERWDEIRFSYVEEMLQVWREFAPNLDESNILNRLVQTPYDVERHIPNMVGGDTNSGELSEAQALHNRPFPECSNYRTPVPGLYMCGSSCHPHGSVTGGPGYNAAGVICRDLRIEPWWKPHDVREIWGALPTS